MRILDDAIPVFGALGYVRERIGSAAESARPTHNHYESRDGRWVAVACTNDPMSRRLAGPWEHRPVARFRGFGAGSGGARTGRARPVVVVAHGTPAEAAGTTLDAAEVPCALVNSVRDLFADPQLKARENIVAVPEPGLGTVHMPGSCRSHGHAGDDPATPACARWGRTTRRSTSAGSDSIRTEYDRCAREA